jgi:hypothetical protein
MAKVRTIQVEFHTQSDDKDKDNGVSETLLFGTQIIGSNRSWGKGLTFRNNSQDLGQEFDVSAHNISAADLEKVTYKVEMDAEQGWHVRFVAIVKLDDGSRHEAGKHEAKLGDHNSFGGQGWHGGRNASFKFLSLKSFV